MSKRRTPEVYQIARSTLLALIILTAINVAMALLGQDTYFLFTNYLAYVLAVYAAIFHVVSGDGVYLAAGIILPLLVLVPYFLCWLLSKKRRGWMLAAMLLFIFDTGILTGSLVANFSAARLPDLFFHILILFYLIRAVRRGRPGTVESDGVPVETLPEETEFYDASLGERPDSRPVADPVEKYRVLVSASWGSHVIEARRSRGLTELVIDGKVYGRQEGILEVEYRIEARLGGHVIATEFRTNGKQLILVDEEIIARKQRLF